MNAIAPTQHFLRAEEEVSPAPRFKDALRHLVGGVSVITAGVGDHKTGLTVTTAHSLSVEPALMIISVNRKASGYGVITEHRHFCVNILSDDQQAVAERFSGVGGIKGKDRYDGHHWSVLETGALALDGALANIDCEVSDIIERHSHALFIGNVRAVRSSPDRRAQLVYQHGAYGSYVAHPHGFPG